MENKKHLVSLLATLALGSLLYIRLEFGSGNKIVEYVSDILIVIHLLGFAPQILLLVFTTPFVLCRKIKLAVNGSSKVNQTFFQKN